MAFEGANTYPEQVEQIWNIQEKSEQLIHPEIDELISLLRNDFDWNDDFWDQEAELLKFQKYVNSLDDEKKQYIIKTFWSVEEPWADPERIWDDIYDNGYIISDISFLHFSTEFWANFEEASNEEKVKYDQDEVWYEQENIKLMNEISEALGRLPEVLWLRGANLEWEAGRKLNTLIKEWNLKKPGDDVQDILKLQKEFLDILKNNPAEREALLGAIYKDPELYNSLKSYVIALDSSFEATFKVYENLHPANPIEGTIIKWAFSNNNIERNGDMLESEVWNGQKIVLDLSKIPPERFISNGTFSLKTKLSIWEFYPAISEYWIAFENAQKETLPQNARLESAKNYLESPEFQNSDLNVTKRRLLVILGEELSNELWVTFASSKEILSNKLSSINQKIKENTDLLSQLEYEYQNALEWYLSAYRKTMEQKDLITREALGFITTLGLDIIMTQTQLTEILARIKRWDLKLNLWVSFDPQNTNLAEWNFWEPRNEDNRDQFRWNMTRFANKILWLSPEWLNQDGEMTWFDIETYRKLENWAQPKMGTELTALYENAWLSSEKVGIDRIVENLKW